jgi:small subunit ribosomal protein S19
MTRSIWKGPFTSFLYKKKRPNKIWSRSSVILPEYIGFYFQIYNGKNFISLKVSDEMIGHKFGEFATTRKKATHKKKRK